MKNCTLCVSIKAFNEITKAIKEVFSDKIVKVFEEGYKIKVINKRLFSKSSITFSIMTKESQNEKFQSMLEGMHGFYYGIETPFKEIQEKLLMQITAFNAAVGIVSEKEIDKDTFKRILEVVSKINGTAFMPTGDMLNKDGKVILGHNGECEVEDYTVTVSSDFIDGNIKVTESGEARKNRTMELLKNQGINVMDGLPVIVGDEHVFIRSKEEIVKRAIASCIIAMYSADLAGDEDIREYKKFYKRIIEQFGAEDFFTEKEKNFMYNDNPDKVECVQFAWQYECYWVFLWALSYVDELDFPDEICDVKTVIECLKYAGSYENFYNKAVVREKEEILDQADIIYRHDWACVNARINNYSAPGGLNDEVVVERHRALNWLINYEDLHWDYVRTDT